TSEPAQSEHGDMSPGGHTTVADRIERRHPGAAHRGGIAQVECSWHPGQRLGRDGDRFGPSARVTDTGNPPLRDVHQVAAAACRAVPAAATEPSHCDPVTHLPSGNIRAELGDRTCDLVTWSDREPGIWARVGRTEIGTTHATGGHTDTYPPLRRRGVRHACRLQLRSRGIDLHGESGHKPSLLLVGRAVPPRTVRALPRTG